MQSSESGTIRPSLLPCWNAPLILFRRKRYTSDCGCSSTWSSPGVGCRLRLQRQEKRTTRASVTTRWYAERQRRPSHCRSSDSQDRTRERSSWGVYARGRRGVLRWMRADDFRATFGDLFTLFQHSVVPGVGCRLRAVVSAVGCRAILDKLFSSGFERCVVDEEGSVV